MRACVCMCVWGGGGEGEVGEVVRAYVCMPNQANERGSASPLACKPHLPGTIPRIACRQADRGECRIT